MVNSRVICWSRFILPSCIRRLSSILLCIPHGDRTVFSIIEAVLKSITIGVLFRTAWYLNAIGSMYFARNRSSEPSARLRTW